MRFHLLYKILGTALAIFVTLMGQSCTPAAPASATETEDAETSTPQNTSTPMHTATAEATATYTETPLPTATFTPNVTATQLPEYTPAAEGKGAVIGLVLWNDQPVPEAAVWLCEKFQGSCVGTYQYRTNTDQNGYYVFNNVTPGKYIVAINSFSTGWFIFYLDRGGAREQIVEADENLVLDPWSIWKFDLQPTAPKYKQVLSDPHPVFTWEAYADAAYYQIYIQQHNPYDLNSVPKLIVNTRVDGTEFTPEEEFISCQYFWQVEAYNTQGVKIAQIHPQNQYGQGMVLTNADLPTKC